MSAKAIGGPPYQRGKWNRQLAEKFCAALAENGLFNRAAYACGITPQSVRDHIKSDPEFASDVERARQNFVEMLEEEAINRAVIGWDEPLVSMGSIVGHKRVKSEGLLQTLLKANAPKKYRENSTVDVATQNAVLVLPAPMTRETWLEVVAQTQTPDGAVIPPEQPKLPK